MGNNALYNLLDYESWYIKRTTTKEHVISYSLSVVDASINENIILRQHFDISEDGKRLNSLKTWRRSYFTLIINET